MQVLGIDPGGTTGWCLYDSAERRVLSAGQFPGAERDAEFESALEQADAVALERIVPHGASYPEVVAAANTAGRLAERVGECVEIKRPHVRSLLQSAVHGAVRVRNDATVWAALVELHGEGSGKKARTRKGVVVEQAGALGGVMKHERAALAVAVAFVLRQKFQTEGRVAS